MVRYCVAADDGRLHVPLRLRYVTLRYVTPRGPRLRVMQQPWLALCRLEWLGVLFGSRVGELGRGTRSTWIAECNLVPGRGPRSLQQCRGGWASVCGRASSLVRGQGFSTIIPSYHPTILPSYHPTETAARHCRARVLTRLHSGLRRERPRANS